MALFSKTKKTPPETYAMKGKEEKQSGAPVLRSPGGAGDLAHVLRHARITEKASQALEQSVYVFDVAESASKRDVMATVRKLYGVSPRKVAIATVPSKVKRSARTGKVGRKAGGKKAYVYLKKGDAINL